MKITFKSLLAGSAALALAACGGAEEAADEAEAAGAETAEAVEAEVAEPADATGEEGAEATAEEGDGLDGHGNPIGPLEE